MLFCCYYFLSSDLLLSSYTAPQVTFSTMAFTVPNGVALFSSLLAASLSHRLLSPCLLHQSRVIVIPSPVFNKKVSSAHLRQLSWWPSTHHRQLVARQGPSVVRVLGIDKSPSMDKDALFNSILSTRLPLEAVPQLL
jgi:hypothetical protein